MNDRMNPLSPLCAAARRAAIARTGAALVLAFGAAQAGATTHTVPLQFNLTLTAPVCSLTVGTATANATTPTATGVTVNLTPTALAVIASPNTIAGAIPGFTNITANAPGIHGTSGYTVAKRMDTPPTASATCTLGTPMIARVSKVSTATNASPATTYMAGAPGASQAGTLPIGMLMGIASFGGVNGVSGSGGTTLGTTVPTVTATATGAAQALNLTASVFANSATLLTASQSGLWTYSYNVNLDF